MAIKIALAGNPNSGKTTLFNHLTGANQTVGNWPGVTVEKKEGRLKGRQDVILQDLPGIYSLSPYSMEEAVARGYLVNERPDAILNIVDATNIERNLYLTTQLAELGIPMVVALNMIDVSRKAGDVIDAAKLAKSLGCPVIPVSALRGEGCLEAANAAADAAAAASPGGVSPHVFSGAVEHALAHIEDLITHRDGCEPAHHHHADGSVHPGGIVDDSLMRWYAVKLFERDEKAAAALDLPQGIRDAIADIIAQSERDMGDDAETIITNQRYDHIVRVVAQCVRKGRPAGALSPSARIDRIVTSRWLGLPIFAAVMFLVYYVSITTVGAIVTDFTNDTFVAQWIQQPVTQWLESIGTADWLVGLVCEGVIGGVGAVIGFVPQMFVLFFFLSILEDVGYMSRVAFIMDRVFRKFGLSGKSFIPLLISSGCSVPGIMASRTIENDRDRKMTVLTAPFIPCSAKMPIVGLMAGAMFGNAGWVAFVAYMVGVAAVVISGVTLKKTRLFAGEAAPFVMELPAYHAPSWKNVLRSMGERGGSFIKRAGTLILLSSVLIWLTSNYGWAKQGEAVAAFGRVENADESILGVVGGFVSPIFKPLGFGAWQPTVATVMGLVAKEEVVNVFGVLYGAGDAAIAGGFHAMSGGYGALAAFAFLLFNLLCAPCFAAMGAIRREMNSGKWTTFAIAYQCVFAYAVALMVYQLGRLIAGAGFTAWTAAALITLCGMLYLLARKNPHSGGHTMSGAMRANGKAGA